MKTTAILSILLLATLAIAAPAEVHAQADDSIHLSDLKIGSARQGFLSLKVDSDRQIGRTKVVVRLSWDGDSEDVYTYGVPIPSGKVLIGRKPFPCNTTSNVRAEVVSPNDYAGTYIEKEIERTCNTGSGTPNLVPVGIRRTGSMQDRSLNQTSSVEVLVTVKNDSRYNMPWNNQGGTPWKISVQGMSPSQHEVRQALRAGQQYTFRTFIALACYNSGEDKNRDVWVAVDSVGNPGNIVESNENDNRATYKVEAKPCKDAG